MFDSEFEAAYRAAADRLEVQFAAVFGPAQAEDPGIVYTRPRDRKAQPNSAVRSERNRSCGFHSATCGRF
jgi:hypothetical protein